VHALNWFAHEARRFDDDAFSIARKPKQRACTALSIVSEAQRCDADFETLGPRPLSSASGFPAYPAKTPGREFSKPRPCFVGFRERIIRREVDLHNSNQGWIPE